MMAIAANGAMLTGGANGWAVGVQAGAVDFVEWFLIRFAGVDNRTSSSSVVSISDLQDVKLSLDGDSQAYRRIVEKYQQHVGGLLRKFARDEGAHEELVQDVFVAAYTSLGTYGAKAPFEHWLARIAVRVGYRYWKEQARKGQAEHFTLEEWDRIVDDDVNEVDPARASKVLYGLLAQLPARDRLVLTLRYLEGCSIDQTAQRTGWSRSMVKVQTWRAKRKLKKLFDEQGRSIEL